MSDLIRRSALIEQLRAEGNLSYLVKGAIDNAPTAYNVDKVVEQLADAILCDGCSNYTNCFELNKRSECGSYKAIEKIVKAGGVE